MQDAVAGGVDLPGAEFREARRRIDAQELDAELQFQDTVAPWVANPTDSHHRGG